MKSFAQYIVEANDGLAKIKAMKPITLCDLLKSPNPKKFITLMNQGAVEVVWDTLSKQQRANVTKSDLDDVKWVNQLQLKAVNFDTWFDQQGGNKASSINIMRECMTCKDRAAWTKWSGKAYRGVGRSLKRIRDYKFTGEIETKNGETYLIAHTNYKGKYAVQSWTDTFSVAQGFDTGGTTHVIFEIDLSKKDTFLNPEVINQISRHKGEAEILRVSEETVDAKAYVSLVGAISQAEYEAPSGSTAPEYVERLVGKDAAKKLLANKTFRKKIGM